MLRQVVYLIAFVSAFCCTTLRATPVNAVTKHSDGALLTMESGVLCIQVMSDTTLHVT